MTPVLLALTVPGGPCEAPTTTRDLSQTLDDAVHDFERLDIEGFEEAVDALDAQIPCLREPLPRSLAADIHRTKGIRAVGERDELANRMFAAARSIEPAYTFPRSLVPDGNPIRLVYADFDLSEARFEDLPPPDGTLTFDGRRTTRRPLDWPTLVQWTDPNGQVGWTVWLAPDAEMPAYPEPPEDSPVALPAPEPMMPDPVPPPEPIPTTRSARGPLLGAAVGSAALTGVLYALAGVSEAQYKDPTTPDAELPALRSRANSLVIGSGFTGAAAIGLTIAGIAAK